VPSQDNQTTSLRLAEFGNPFLEKKYKHFLD